jgi:hypothetical protein
MKKKGTHMRLSPSDIQRMDAIASDILYITARIQRTPQKQTLKIAQLCERLHELQTEINQFLWDRQLDPINFNDNVISIDDAADILLDKP